MMMMTVVVVVAVVVVVVCVCIKSMYSGWCDGRCLEGLEAGTCFLWS